MSEAEYIKVKNHVMAECADLGEETQAFIKELGECHMSCINEELLSYETTLAQSFQQIPKSSLQALTQYQHKLKLKMHT